MTRDQIHLALTKNSETHIQLNIANVLMSDLGKGDAIVVESRGILKTASNKIKDATSIYNEVAKKADTYIEMAKALGDNDMLKRLQNIKKDAIAGARNVETHIKKINAI